MRGAPALAALAACGLCGCGPAALPLPRVLSIEPNTMTSSSFTIATVTVDAVLPFHVDYGSGEVRVDSLVLMSVGPVPVGDGTYVADGRLPARIPSRLVPATYDVTVTTVTDNRTGVLPGGFTVTPGVWPGGGFAIANIPSPQHVDVPFLITISALGANAGSFNGTVDYVISNITDKPIATGPFSSGVYQESLVLHAVSMGPIHITVYDLLGRTATSNDFLVNP